MWSLVSMEFLRHEPVTILAWEHVMAQRSEKLWQIALSMALFRYQCQHRRHFELAQPRGSALMKTPGMSEIRAHTLLHEFDMCRVGSLRDPETREAIRKRMAVCSNMFRITGPPCSSTWQAVQPRTPSPGYCRTHQSRW